MAAFEFASHEVSIERHKIRKERRLENIYKELFSKLDTKNLTKLNAPFFEMAEREGFEPSVEVSSHTRLAGERLQPTRPSLQLNFLAEGVGFEPTVPFRTAIFKTAALNHSAIPPANRFYIIMCL